MTHLQNVRCTGQRAEDVAQMHLRFGHAQLLIRTVNVLLRFSGRRY